MDNAAKTFKAFLHQSLLGLLCFTFLTGFRGGEIVQVNQDYNGRTSSNFLSRSNIALIVPAGTVGKVIMVQNMASGNRGVMIEIQEDRNRKRRVWLYDWANRDDDIKLCATMSCQTVATTPETASAAQTITAQNGYGVAPVAQSTGAPEAETPTYSNGNQSLEPTTLNCSPAALRQANNQFACMACNCMYEAGGESFEGQKAVGEVVMARVHYNNWGSSPCAVILQPWQFEWTRRNPGRRRIHGQCMQATQHAISNTTPRWATHFHSGARPNWARSTQCRPASPARIGGHSFYSCDVPQSTIASRYSRGSQLAAQENRRQTQRSQR